MTLTVKEHYIKTTIKNIPNQIYCTCERKYQLLESKPNFSKVLQKKESHQPKLR